MTAVAVGTITVAKLWMRPIGAISAGFIGDYVNLEKTLGWLLLASTLSLIGIILVPTDASVALLLVVVLAIGLLTYAVRGIFWGTLDRADIPNQTKGLAIGVVSFIGYSPDIYLPLINGPILETWPGRAGYSMYFGLIVLTGFIGAAAAFRLQALVAVPGGQRIIDAAALQFLGDSLSVDQPVGIRSLAVDVAEHGILVNAVAPGVISTKMTEQALQDREAEYRAQIPLGRIGTPLEVAHVVLFLISPAAQYITGQTIHVNGGMWMG